MRNLLKAIEISRPLLWLNTSMPLLWGAIGLRGELVASDVVLFASFLFPYNYFLHAPNDYFDFETDARNPRKGGVEGALTPKPLLARHAIISTLLLALPYLALCFIGRDARGEAGRRLYRLFLIANVALGASITMLVLLSVSVDAAIPAGILAMGGTAIALGVSVGRAVLQRR
jgi:hypothetical protein